MQLIINGESQTLEAVTSVQQLLTGLGYDGTGRIAVAIDGRFVPRQAYDSVSLRENQVIDVVSPMQGG